MKKILKLVIFVIFTAVTGVVSAGDVKAVTTEDGTTARKKDGRTVITRTSTVIIYDKETHKKGVITRTETTVTETHDRKTGKTETTVTTDQETLDSKYRKKIKSEKEKKRAKK